MEERGEGLRHICLRVSPEGRWLQNTCCYVASWTTALYRNCRGRGLSSNSITSYIWWPGASCLPVTDAASSVGGAK